MDRGRKTYPGTPLQHWFRSFSRLRNDIIHDGRLTSPVYGVEGSAYNGPYLFVGERVLREACRVALRAFGFEDLWKSRALRLTARMLRPVIDRLMGREPPSEG